MTYEQLQKANETIKTTDIKGKAYAEVNQRIADLELTHLSPLMRKYRMLSIIKQQNIHIVPNARRKLPTGSR